MYFQARFKACVVHLLISILVSVLCAGLVFLLWYPPPYYILSGGLGLFGLVIAVDLILGPLLTLIAFDIRKSRSHLVRDLVVIGLLQAAALGYGLHTVYVARPVILAAENLLFHVVTANAVATGELSAVSDQFKQLSMTGPRLVGVRLATSGQEKLDSIAQALAGWDSGARPTYWEDYELTKPRVISQLKDVSKLNISALKYMELESVLSKLNQSPASVGYADVKARVTGWVMLVERSSGKPLEFFNTGT